MSIEILEPDVVEEVTPVTSGVDMPPIYGRCPICGKPLYPRDKNTGELLPKYMLERDGYWRRAKCGACYTILYYRGSGVWVAWDGSKHEMDDISEEHHGK